MKISKFNIKEAREDEDYMKNQCEECGGRGIDPATTPSMNVPCLSCKGTGLKLKGFPVYADINLQIKPTESPKIQKNTVKTKVSMQENVTVNVKNEE